MVRAQPSAMNGSAPSVRAKHFRATERIGVSGYAVQSGYIIEKERNPALAGARKFQTYSELLANVEIIGACVRYFLAMVTRPSCIVEPADKSAEAQKISLAVDEIIHDLERPWTRVVKRAALSAIYGYSWQEWIAKKRADGLVGLLDIEPRACSTIARWDVDEAGTVHGVWQQSPASFRELYIPRAKSVYVCDDVLSESPEGLGIMRHAAPAGQMLQAYERLEGVGFESDMRGVPVGRAPYGELQERVRQHTLSQADSDAMTAPIESMVTDHLRSVASGVVLDSSVYEGKGESATPSGAQKWGLELLTADVGSMAELANAIARKTRGIARLFHLEGILLGESGAGSLAMADSKAEAFGMLIDSTLAEIASQFDKDIIGPLMRLNGWPPDLAPWFSFGNLPHLSAKDITGALVDLSRAGAPLGPDDEDAVNAVRELVGLPRVHSMSGALDAGLRGATGMQLGDGDDEDAELDDAELDESERAEAR